MGLKLKDLKILPQLNRVLMDELKLIYGARLERATSCNTAGGYTHHNKTSRIHFYVRQSHADLSLKQALGIIYESSCKITI